ncbi:hypothetical protein H4696_008021 [Amycolatopsis lexingtonensis]|uniref:Uncharacterized protein n=1 Tax=Amycolatopsis lexingtonensis TaxID=218822 RepID=A0ABR9ICL9_9PSEU|nr:hypothetical protein [Amycolatopsis lexingtonensis]MBE1500921.1 hypothetical protein [Amycolatopsis lexingtonensis]
MTVIGRCLGVLAGLLLVGVVMRLTELILRPVLPPVLMNALDQGWATLISILSPALGPIAAVLILAGLGWVVASRRR